MKIFVRHIIVVFVLLFSMSYTSYGQRPCPPGQVPCGPDHTCKDRIECRGGPNPPPPGLVVPIDTNLSLLLVAGLGLGIYFLVSSGKKEQLKS